MIRHIDQIIDRPAFVPFVRCRCAQDLFRLVEGDIDFLHGFDAQTHTIHHDDVGFGIGFITERCHLAVDSDAPLFDHGFGAAS